MKFSELFRVTPTEADDWFDPLLSLDTRLFLDPFLIYAQEAGSFAGSHAEIIGFFNSVFRRVAASAGDSRSTNWRLAADHLRFPEVSELCLGYTAENTRGSGSGRQISELITSALWEAIQAGLAEITHFEETGLLREGIGADRISDAVASLLRSRITAYTQAVCTRHRIPVQAFHYQAGRFDRAAGRWIPLDTRLPRNPYSGKAVFLVPRRYLRALPTINPDSYWDYCIANENDLLRREFGEDITRRVSKHQIVEFARSHIETVPGFIRACEARPPTPYDTNADPAGLVSWYARTAEYVTANAIALSINSPQAFRRAIDRLVETFKGYVEDNRGWNLLWNDNGTPRAERAAQDLFLGIVVHYCRANDIDISREANLGRGAVDFKVARGYRLRALLEVKLAKNTKFWNGLERQLPTYQRTEGVALGYFIVIALSDSDIERTRDIARIIRGFRPGYQIRLVVVDARRNPPSASTL